MRQLSLAATVTSVVLAVLVAGCFPFFADFGSEVVAINESGEHAVVQVDYLYLSSQERTYFTPVPAGAARVVFVWGHPNVGPGRLVVLDVLCRPISEHSGAGVEGTTIRISRDGSVTYDNSPTNWTGPRPDSNEGLGFASCAEAAAAMAPLTSP
jgi:hypothetical protein